MSEAHLVPRAVLVVGDVIHSGNTFQADESAAVERAVAVSSKRTDPGVEVSVAWDGGACRTGREVTRDQEVGCGDVCAVAERAGNEQCVADDLEGGDLCGDRVGSCTWR